MKITGLITEYNPFHNGHRYHLQKAKELTDADAIIVVMSGDYVQRGEPAVMPKYLRTQAALEAGASVVLELPVCYATGSAEYFARGAIALLDSLGCVDAVCFGSECGDIEILENIAEVFLEEPERYRVALQEYLKEGKSFPVAREQALMKYWNETEENLDKYEEVLKNPNNILGIEYIKAMKLKKSRMKACTIQRIVAGYHDENLANVDSKEKISSASAIRKNILAEDTCESVQKHVPENAMYLYEKYYKKRYPVVLDDFSLLLKYRLLSEDRESLKRYADMSDELAGRILNHLDDYRTVTGFCEKLKTREMTYTRISRSLLHVLLNITSQEMEEYKRMGDCFYARILGFQKEQTEILGIMKRKSRVPLVTKISRADKALDAYGQRMLRKEIFASNLYESVLVEKYDAEYQNEYRKQIIRN